VKKKLTKPDEMIKKFGDLAPNFFCAIVVVSHGMTGIMAGDV